MELDQSLKSTATVAKLQRISKTIRTRISGEAKIKDAEAGLAKLRP
jgi:hypothetical protein